MIAQLQALLDPGIQAAPSNQGVPQVSGEEFSDLLSALLAVKGKQPPGLVLPQKELPEKTVPEMNAQKTDLSPPAVVSPLPVPAAQTPEHAAQSDQSCPLQVPAVLPQGETPDYIIQGPMPPGPEENLTITAQPEQGEDKTARQAILPIIPAGQDRGTAEKLAVAEGAMILPHADTRARHTGEYTAGKTEKTPELASPNQTDVPLMQIEPELHQPGTVEGVHPKNPVIAAPHILISETSPGKNTGTEDSGFGKNNGRSHFVPESDRKTHSRGTGAGNDAGNPVQNQPVFTLKPHHAPANNAKSAESQTEVPVRDLGRELPRLVTDRLPETYAGQGGRDFIIRLEPKELGQLVVKLTTQEGVVSVKIITENAEARALLDHGMPALKQSLLEQGIRYGRMDVELEPGGQYISQNHDHDHSRQQQGWSRYDTAEKMWPTGQRYPEIEAIASAVERSPEYSQGLVDYRI